MSGIEILYIVFLLVCLLISAFFSSSEIAFISLQRIKLKHMVKTEVEGADRVAKLMERPEKFLSTVLLGNTLVNAAATALATALAIKYWPGHGVVIATIGMTIVILIFSEAIPKTIANQHAERLSLVYARPLGLLLWLLTPFVLVLSWISSRFSKLVGGTPIPRSLVSAEEIRTMISVGHEEGTVKKSEAEMLHNVFDFGDRPVYEIMVPRTEVVWVEKGIKLADFMKIYAESPLTRFPVYEENRDKVVGILSIKDILMARAKGTINDESRIDDLVRPAYFTPEYKRIGELFTEMKEKNYRMAVVIDEYGGTRGIVSLSQLVEEVVGVMGDELDEAEKEYEAIDEYTFQIDGGMRIEEANTEMGLEFPEGDYETVAGFILHLLGRIPKEGEQLRYKGMNLTITEMRGVKIEKVLLAKKKYAAHTD